MVDSPQGADAEQRAAAREEGTGTGDLVVEAERIAAQPEGLDPVEEQRRPYARASSTSGRRTSVPGRVWTGQPSPRWGNGFGRAQRVRRSAPIHFAQLDSQQGRPRVTGKLVAEAERLSTSKD